MVRYLKTPEAAERLHALGIDVKWTTPDEMRQWVNSQLKFWGSIAKDAGVVPQ
jgi:tripartite-type tricarboxylate transporter receptor subunit TctC